MSDQVNDVDFAVLAKRYDEEKAKRRRADGIAQYQEAKGKFAHFAEDPWSTAEERDPIEETVDVVVFGAGFGGLLAAAHLRMAGIESIRMLDKAGGFGGTWYWNRYPGCACDIESYIYLPLLEETGYMPTEKYVKSGEIREHCNRIAEHYDLTRTALFNTAITTITWNEPENRWLVETARGDRISARFVVSSTGTFDKPKLPGIPGIEDFEGHTFHSSRWDYGYTGGDASGNMTGLADKTVGIVGTGATGVQAAAKLAGSAKHLYVLQRTPTSIDRRDNKPTDPDWVRSLEPGWQKQRRLNFTKVCGGILNEGDLVDDAWSNNLKTVSPPADGSPFDPETIHLAEMRKMEETRRRVDEIVEDHETAEALKAYYHYMCKRPGFSDEYLQIFNQPNVTLVDTAGRGVERVTAKGVVVDGVEYPLDCLVFATGFDFMLDYGRETGIQVHGRDGEVLDDQWKDGRRTMHGMLAHGFPNFLWMSYTQSGPDSNFTHSLSTQAEHLSYIVAEAMARGLNTIEPTAEAVEEWVDIIRAGFPDTQAFFERCIPGYYTSEGVITDKHKLNTTYRGGILKFIELLQDWREQGDMAGIRTT